MSGFESESPDLDRPGRQLHQQGLCEARLGYQDESPQLGAPGPGLEHACRHCIDRFKVVFITRACCQEPCWSDCVGSAPELLQKPVDNTVLASCRQARVRCLLSAANRLFETLL